MMTELVTVGGVVVAAAIGYAGVRYTAKQSENARRMSLAQEEKAVDAEAYERARDSYEAAISQYLKEIQRLGNRVDQLNDRIIRLNDDILNSEQAKREERRRLEQLKAEYEQHIEWCSARLDRLRTRLAAHEEISEDDPDLLLDY